ncbi:CRTAC1 family protein [Halovulum sp. GXIMD14793]
MRYWLVVFLAGIVSFGAAYAEPPHFVDATAAAGIRHSYQGGTDYIVGGGAAAFDCDNNGLPDLALAGAEQPMALLRNTGKPGRPPAFERAETGIPPILNTTGIYPLDIDNDAITDLMVLRFGRNLLLQGLGDCRFKDVTDAYGLPERQDWTTAFAAHWQGDATLPTLFIGNYVPRDRPLQSSGNCQTSYVLRPDGDTYQAPLEIPGACTLSALFLDWSGQGIFDLRLANDREYYDRGQTEQLFRLTPDGVQEFTRDDGWDDVSVWGMGLAAQDLTGDGLPEVVVTSMADNRIESPRGADLGPRFDNIARRLKATAQRPYVGNDVRPSTAWHTAFGDANNDGWPDLLIIKGNVDEMPGMAAYDPDNLLLGSAQGFTEVGYQAGIAVDTKGRGGVFADLNGDGALDILTVNRNQPVRLFAGKPTGGWVTIDPRQPGSNRFAVGVKVELRFDARIQAQTRAIGGGHAGGLLLPLHFGLGAADRAEFRIVWPDGTATDWQDIKPGDAMLVDRTQP